MKLKFLILYPFFMLLAMNSLFAASLLEKHSCEKKPVFKRKRYLCSRATLKNQEAETSESSKCAHSVGGFRKISMPWLYQDGKSEDFDLAPQKNETICSDISKDMMFYNVFLLEPLRFYKVKKESRILFAFDFDHNLVKVDNGAIEIWKRISEVTNTDSVKKNSKNREYVLENLTEKQAAYIFKGTEKGVILKHLLRALEKDQYVAIVTNNTDASMIRAFLKFFAPVHYKKIPIIYRRFKQADGELKEIHLIRAHNNLVRFGRISRIILTDDQSQNIESATELGQSLTDVLIEAYQTDKYSDRSDLDLRASEKLKCILDLLE